MPRRRKGRWIWNQPEVVLFRPKGVPARDLETSQLGLDEVEAIRLADLQQLKQADAAEHMNISQSTFHRILKDARHKMADAILNGKAIELKGGDGIMPTRDGTGPAGAGLGRGRGGGRGVGGGRRGGYGGPTTCKCPECGHAIPHTRGIPCATLTCPECAKKKKNVRMIPGDVNI